MSDQDLNFLHSVDSKNLVALIQNEHPQILAVIFSLLQSQKSSELLSFLPRSLCTEILFRISRLAPVSQDLFLEVQESLQILVNKLNSSSLIKSENTKLVADMLKTLDVDEREDMLAKLAAKDPDVAAKVRDKIFVFSDLETFPQQELQKLIENRIRYLANSPKGCLPKFIDKFLAICQKS